MPVSPPWVGSLHSPRPLHPAFPLGLRAEFFLREASTDDRKGYFISYVKTAGKEEVLFLALLAVIRTPLRDESCLQYPPADEGWNLASVPLAWLPRGATFYNQYKGTI